VAAIDDDLDTPGAFRVLRQTLRSSLPPDERRWLVLDMDIVLGLDLDRPAIPARDDEAALSADLPALAQTLLNERAAARTARDWETADRLREQLHALGVDPIDRPDGASGWRRLR
jgi:cysteinyl-tRNA synthetase